MYAGVPTAAPIRVTTVRAALRGVPRASGASTDTTAEAVEVPGDGASGGRPAWSGGDAASAAASSSAGSSRKAGTASPKSVHADPTVRGPDEHVVGLAVP
jgi:hypothetical protein